MKFLHVLPLLAICGVAAAQNRAIAPIDHTDPAATQYPFHFEGSSFTPTYPLSAGIARVMYVLDVWEGGRQLLNLPANAAITSISFPADMARQSFGHSLQLEVRMAHTRKTAANVESTYDNNYNAGAAQTVFPLQVWRMPDLNNPLYAGGLLSECRIPLTTPFVYNGTDNLAVEFRVTANSNGNQSFNYWLDRGTHRSPVTSHGQGCATSGGSTPTLVSSPSVIGSSWLIRLSGAPASSNTTLGIGFGLYPSPVPLAPVQAPGCTLDAIAVANVSGTTNTNGSASWSFQVGNDIVLWQLSVYSQAISTDLFANPLGIVTSNADQMTLGVNPRVTMIQRAGDASAATGSINTNWGQLIYLLYN